MKPTTLLTLLGLCGLLACDLPIYEDVKPECNIAAEFTPSPTSCVAPCLVSINNTSNTTACEVTYTWTFDDGSPPAFGQSPGSHNYDEIGVYNLCLTIVETADLTNIDTACVTINVTNATDPPVANFTATPGNCFGYCPITFTSTSVGAINHEWYFNGETTPLTGQQVTHTFTPSHEPYLVELKVSNSGGRDSVTKEVNVPWRMFAGNYSAEELGPAVSLMQMPDSTYIVVGKMPQAPAIPYFARLEPDGSLGAGPCTSQLRIEDRIEDAVWLPESNEVIAIGKTKNQHEDDDDILFWKFNPQGFCSSPNEPIPLGDIGIDERAKAIVAVEGGDRVVIASEIYQFQPNADDIYLVGFSRHGLSGVQLSGDPVALSMPIESLVVEDILRAPNGDYWICGGAFPLNGFFQEGFLLHLDNSGAFLADYFYDDPSFDIVIRALAVNQAGTHLLAYGENFAGQLKFLRGDLSNPMPTTLQNIAGGSVTSPYHATTLVNGSVLLAGGGSGGCALQSMSEQGVVGQHRSYGSSNSGYLASAILALDGGCAAAGNQVVPLFFVKTDDQLNTN